MGSSKVKIINALFDDVHGLFAYTIQDPNTLKLKRITFSQLKKNIEYISNAHLKENGHIEIDKIDKIYCGKDYTKATGSFKSGFNDFETFCRLNGREDLLDEYNTDKNPKPVDMISAHAIDTVWWKCSKCGYEWATPIKSRTCSGTNTGCNQCRALAGKAVQLFKGINDFKTWCIKNNRQDILDSVSPDSPYKADELALNSRQKMKFSCNVCKHDYWATPIARSRQQHCPYCSKAGTSFPELAIYYAICEIFSIVKNKYRFMPVGRSLELDIYIKDINLGIEYDGVYWHNIDGVQEREAKKDAACKALGIRLLRVKEAREISTSDDPLIVDTNTILCQSSGMYVDKVIRLIATWIRKNYHIDECRLSDNQIATAISTAKAAVNMHKVPNSVAEVAPEVAARWDYEKNGSLKPENVSRGCKYKAWFKCPDCGNSYYSFIRKQVNGQRCPICAGQKVVPGYNDFETNASFAMPFWDFEKNSANGVYPNMISKKSNKAVHWKCPDCGYEMEANPRTFASKHYCTSCGKAIRGGTSTGEYMTDWEKKRALNPKDVRRFKAAKGLCGSRGEIIDEPEDEPFYTVDELILQSRSESK